MKYAIKNNYKGEYLRKGYETADAFTDDLGHAALFKTRQFAEFECQPGERVVEIEEDVDGALYEVPILPCFETTASPSESAAEPLPFEPSKDEI